jgi:hypothetical protein
MRFSASYISSAHTICAYSAFGAALALGLLLHYKKIVKNGVAGYPEEWFPSVSSTYVYLTHQPLGSLETALGIGIQRGASSRS